MQNMITKRTKNIAKELECSFSAAPSSGRKSSSGCLSVSFLESTSTFVGAIVVSVIFILSFAESDELLRVQ